MQERSAQLMQYPADPLQTGQQITQLILTSPSAAEVLPAIGRALAASLQADACIIIAEGEGDRPVQVTAIGARLESFPIAGQQIKLKYPTIKAALAEVELLAINSFLPSEWLPEAFAGQAVLGMATKCQGQVNGAVFIGRDRPWSESEPEAFKIAAAPIALAISQARAQRQLQVAAQYQTLLNQISKGIRGALNAEQILQMALTGTAQALEVDRGWLLLLKYTDPIFNNPALKRIARAKATVACEWLNPAANHLDASAISPSLLNASFWLSECVLCQQALAIAPQPLIISDRYSDAADAYKTSTLDDSRWAAMVMFPLEHQSTVLGFFVLQQYQPRAWQPEELELIGWASAQASSAIIQTQTLRQVQNLVEERTAQLQRSLEVQAKLYATTRQQIDQLRQLNQLKDEFLNAMSHELRTPLTKMNLAIRMLHQQELPSERRQLYLEILEQQCTQEINLINDLLALQQLESKKSPFQPQKIDLKQLIEDLAASFRQQWADKGLDLAIDFPKRSLTLASDYESVNRILLELLTNAGKYSEPQTTVDLKVTCETRQSVNQVAIAIHNCGFGISPLEQAHIFDKFWRGKEATGQVVPGTGLGLALVKCLVQHLNGNITVSSVPIANSQSYATCFTLTLPQFSENLKV